MLFSSGVLQVHFFSLEDVQFADRVSWEFMLALDVVIRVLVFIFIVAAITNILHL